PDALLFVLSVFFRKIFILQLVGLVLTSNFTDCDFEKIRMDYLNIISKDLTCTDCDATLRCEDQDQGTTSGAHPSPPPPGRGVGGRMGCLRLRRRLLAVPRAPRLGRGERQRRSSLLPRLLLLSRAPTSSPSVGSLALSSPGSHWLRPPRLLSLISYQLYFFVFLYPYPHPVACSPFLVNVAACEQPDCLTKIERLTLHPTPGCKSLPEELASRTEATLERSCPGYYRKQKNNAQAMKKRKKREDTIKRCQKIVSNLIGLWRRFMRL
ncbi:thymic stromal lymphopoietin, partial [Myotis myotis]|uniref:thymic stromal lymphopoietin n=1 Tax=Myotis myotis TaxID=51298 RepID=UPI00174D23A3